MLGLIYEPYVQQKTPHSHFHARLAFLASHSKILINNRFFSWKIQIGFVFGLFIFVILTYCYNLFLFVCFFFLVIVSFLSKFTFFFIFLMWCAATEQQHHFNIISSTHGTVKHSIMVAARPLTHGDAPAALFILQKAFFFPPTNFHASNSASVFLSIVYHRFKLPHLLRPC